MKHTFVFAAMLLTVSSWVVPAAWAGDDDRRGGPVREGRDYEQKFQQGPCKVERKWEKNGAFKEVRDCKRTDVVGHDHEEKFWDGACRVQRKWQKDGDFKEERECKPA